MDSCTTGPRSIIHKSTKANRRRISLIPSPFNEDVDLVLPGGDIGGGGGDGLFPIDSGMIGDVDLISTATEITVIVMPPAGGMTVRLYKVSLGAHGQQIQETISSLEIPPADNFAPRQIPWTLNQFAIEQLNLIRLNVGLNLRLDFEVETPRYEDAFGGSVQVPIRWIYFYCRDGRLCFTYNPGCLRIARTRMDPNLWNDLSRIVVVPGCV